jgi:hypothetical protein
MSNPNVLLNYNQFINLMRGVLVHENNWKMYWAHLEPFKLKLIPEQTMTDGLTIRLPALLTMDMSNIHQAIIAAKIPYPMPVTYEDYFRMMESVRTVIRNGTPADDLEFSHCITAQKAIAVWVETVFMAEVAKS